MGLMPREPEKFAETVADMLRSLRSEYVIDLVAPKELLVNGRRLDLENLYRMVSHEPSRGTQIVQHYLEQLFTVTTDDLSTMDWYFAEPRLMPRIQPESIFEHLNQEQVAHVPFVNGTVIVFVTDLPHMTVSITTEQMLRWGQTPESLDLVARRNLDASSQDMPVQIVESKEGGKAAIIAQHDGYDAARILLGGLYGRLAPQLGGDFFVATPARDMFVALSARPVPFIERLRERVAHDFRRLPYPIAKNFFLVTRDGIATGGARIA